MSDAAREIAALSPERRRLLELLRAQSAAGRTRGVVRRPEREGALPLSSAQQRLWLAHHTAGLASLLNTPAAVRLGGRLSTGALRATLDEVVRRHEALRTTFKVEGGRPVQVVGPPAPVALPLTDLRRLHESEREAEARRLVAEEASRPFDLERGPLLRARLLCLDEADHVAVFTTHHIVSDGWSMGLLVHEVATLYGAYSRGLPSPLGELPVQYADYALWEFERLEGGLLEGHLAYWRRQLGGELPALELPTDRPRPAAPTYAGASHRFELSAPLTRGLRELCQSADVTLYTLLLAAYAALLYRYTGQDEILVGSPVAGRDRVELEGLVGCFINTLVMRLNLSGNPAFSELLARSRSVVLDALAHREAPFDKVVEAVRPRRAAGHEKPYRVWFVLQNTPQEPLRLPGLEVSDFGVERGTSQNDLTLSMAEEGERVVGALEYSTDLFDADTTAEMLWRFEAMLRYAAARPETRLLDIPLGASADPHDEVAVGEAEDEFAL